ncbi:MAG: DUF4263 domain-containing protein [Coriobacteriia bacterium]|nr:DUF4263 domain-containing protein [Coriobacteriia bacterium]
MNEIRTTAAGVEYAEVRTLQTKQRVETQAHLYRVPHNDPDVVDLALRIGRYNRITQKPDVPEPKSALTLDNVELEALVDYLSECYGPIRDRAQRYIPLGEELGQAEIDDLRRLFNDSDKSVLVELLTTQQVIPAGLLDVVEMCHRRDAVSRFEAMLDEDLPEADWQAWFTANPWVLGTEFVEILDERAIDTANITDYLMRAHDGFVDVVEIKRPDGGLRFWAPRKDHENLYPHTDLVKALTQTMNYLTELELEANSQKFIERVGARVLKPRGILVFGRSLAWGDDELRARRVLNSSFHNMTILTYDDVLERAKRMLHDTVLDDSETLASGQAIDDCDDWDSPF